MSVLYLFNPENDLALANGGKIIRRRRWHER